MTTAKILDASKARNINPFFSSNEYTPGYVKAGSLVQVEIESREMEIAIIKAYDYGIDSLTPEGKKQIQRFIDDALLRMKGKL
ncbi:MAG: hypothetical protein CML06_15035 [Pseudomonadales bacterium]|nr:hypothetical protein [Pseudomonadales bacterium]